MVQAAAAQADAASQTCIGCPGDSIRDEMRKMIRSLTVVCTGTRGTGDCGYTFATAVQTIYVTPEGVNSEPGCGCLKGTILHEALHKVRPGYSEDKVRKTEKNCFRCAR